MNTLVIRADATTSIGTGHFMRCLALGQAWQDQGGKVTFISVCDNKSLCLRLVNEGFNFIAVEKTHPDPGDLDRTLRILGKNPRQNHQNAIWLVLDGYNFDAAYQKRIKEEGYKLLCIDDYGHADHYYADLVLNQNISAEESFYPNREPDTRLLLGTRYALLRREFRKWRDWQREIPTIARKVLVTLGGSDPDNVTLKVIRALRQVHFPGLEAKIVVGPANPNLQILEKAISDRADLQIVMNVANMPELMMWADMAVTAAGSTCWELVFMGVPSITVVTFGNQIDVAKGLERAKICKTMGWFNATNNDVLAAELSALIKDKKLREEKSMLGRKLVDGTGAETVVHMLC